MRDPRDPEIDKIRAWWFHRQGLDGSYISSGAGSDRPATPGETLKRSGWARSVGGANPYITLYARTGSGRHVAERSVAALEIHELPCARGCTYVVPAADFALALKVGEHFAQAPMKVAATLGVTTKEVDILSDAVLKALKKGPLDPEGIREATGSASRNLGEAGKKKGVTTTLPLALGLLQANGEIRRVPIEGRLDQQRYKYARWQPNPLAGFKLSLEEAYVELARRFFSWIGPATAVEFHGFSGLGVRAGNAALAPLNLVALGSNGLLIPAEDLERFREFNAPRRPQYAMTSSLDAIHAHRRDVQGLLDSADSGVRVVVDKDAKPMGGLSDLPSHAIFDRGRLIGLWEYDVESQSIAWRTFGIKDHALEALVKRTESYIRDELGDARSFSLDSARSRAPRIAALRAG